MTTRSRLGRLAKLEAKRQSAGPNSPYVTPEMRRLIADRLRAPGDPLSLCAAGRGEFSREFQHCHVGFFGDAGEQKRPMRIKLGVAPSAARLGGEPSGRAKRLHQPDDERNRHAEMRGSGMT